MHNSHEKNSRLEQKAKALQDTPVLPFQQNEQEEKTTVVKRNCWLKDFFLNYNLRALLTVLLLLRWQSGFHENMSSALSYACF